jgi:genome maintenance exonuclease 1
MFSHSTRKFLEYDDLKCETRESGRKYITPLGRAYPSVTTVLSILSKEGIKKWRDKIGHSEADRISKRASKRGTAVHEIIEKYLDNTPDYASGYLPHVIQSFEDIKIELKNINEIYLQECALYSDHLGLAGRVDCIGKYDSELSVIDFKTSRKPKKKEWISSYFMQCAAYAIMWEERTGIPITKLVILIAVDNARPQVFVEHRDNWTSKLIQTIGDYNERTHI